MLAGDARVTFGPGVPGPDVPALLAGYDVLLCPSMWFENGPTIALEAIAVGTPIIASRVGNLAELIVDDVNGQLVAPGDIDAWARALTTSGDGAGGHDRSLAARAAARANDGRRGLRLPLPLCHARGHTSLRRRPELQPCPIAWTRAVCASSGTSGYSDFTLSESGWLGAGERLNERIYACKRQALRRAIASLGLARRASWSVLDAGCGQGHFARFYRREYPAAAYVGIDISERAVAHLRRSIEGAEFHVADLCQWDDPAERTLRHRPELRGAASDPRRRRRRRARSRHWPAG